VIADETPLDSFKVPIDSVERAAGLLFFDRYTHLYIFFFLVYVHCWKNPVPEHVIFWGPCG
jgi:hypothetical protein